MPEIKNNSFTRFCAEVLRVPTRFIATALIGGGPRLDNFFSYPTYNKRGFMYVASSWQAHGHGD
jgi:hypothetical protein